MESQALLARSVRCRPVVKLFVTRRRAFRRSPDDKPWALCLGSKAGGVIVLAKASTRREIVRTMRATLDWWDTPRGQVAYHAGLRALCEGYSEAKA